MKRVWIVIAIVMLSVVVGCTRDPAKVRAAAMDRADKLEKKSRWAEAVIEYKNAVKADPSSAAAFYRLGLASFKSGDYQDSLIAYRQAVQLQPDFPEAQIALGQFYLVSQQFEEASQLAYAVQSKHPDNVDSYLLMANSYAGRKDYKSATEILSEWLKKHPDTIAAHLNLGAFYLAMRKPELAKIEFESAVALNPALVDARKALATYFLQMGDKVSAEAQLREAVRLNPKSQDAISALADVFTMTGRSQLAEPLYKQMIDTDPSPSTKFALASFYVRQQRLGDALAIDQEIAKSDPKYLPARLQLIELQIHNKNFAPAETEANELAKSYPANADLLVLRSRLLIEQHKTTQAIDMLEKATKQDPRNFVAHFWMAAAYASIGNLPRAQSELEQSIALNDKFVDGYSGLSEMMLNRGQNDDAIRYAQQALQLNPNYSPAYLFIGSAYANQRKLPEAELAFKQFIAFNPRTASGPSRIGFLHLLEKKPDDAIGFFNQALALNPQQYDAVEGYATALIAKGDKQGAMNYIRDKAANSNDPRLLDVAARASMALGDTPQAERWLRKSIAIDKSSQSAYLLLASIYASRNDLSPAIAEAEKGAQINTTDVSSWTMLGMLYQQAGQIEKAKSVYKHVLELDSTAGIAANNLAWIYMTAGGDMDKALDLARQAKLSLPSAPTISDTLGYIYARRELYDMAIPLLQEAVNGDPKDSEFRLHLAYALNRSGKKERAKQELAAALKINPELKSKTEAKTIMEAR